MYAGQGKLFFLEDVRRSPSSGDLNKSRWWLCEKCAPKLRVVMGDDTRITLAKLSSGKSHGEVQ